MDWLDKVAGPNFMQAVLWTGLALVVLVIVLVIVRIVRSMTFGTFVSGGRNRKTRLAVMDAAAVDSQRRLVLVRRDDVEHLILIGGPTDVVVERDIRLHGAVRRPAAAGEQAPNAPPRQRPAEAPAPAPARPAPAAARSEAPRAPSPPAYSAPPAKAPAPSAQQATARAPLPGMPEPNFSTPRAAPATPVNSAPPIPKLRSPDVEKTFDAGKMRPKPPEISLEEEMNRLLGELSVKK